MSLKALDELRKLTRNSSIASCVAKGIRLTAAAIEAEIAARADGRCGMTVFCDNYGCIFIDECGFCDCDNLNIVGGVCDGSYHNGRNAIELPIAATLGGEKFYAVKTWSDLDDIGESYIERKLYRTREEAERRAEEVEAESSDEMHYGAMVVEFEVAE